MVGTSVRDTATVSGGSNPTGTVTFRLFSDVSCTTQVFTSTDDPRGHGHSARSPPTAAGTYRWTADYNGDAYNNAVTEALRCSE